MKALNLVVQAGATRETQKITFEYKDSLPPLTIAVAKEGPAEIVIVNRERGKRVMTFRAPGRRSAGPAPRSSPASRTSATSSPRRCSP